MAEIFYQDQSGTLYTGDSVSILKNLPQNSVDMVVTSPPYWSLRNYKDESRQLGQERLFKDYIYNLCNYLGATWDILKDNGSLWVNIGDTYYGSNKGAGGTGVKSKKQTTNKGSYWNKGNKGAQLNNSKDFKNNELPRKSLCMIPARFCIEMQDRGWVLRNQIIWHKPNAMPNPASDRFSVDYEVIFFFTKLVKSYKFNQQLEPYTTPLARWGGEKLVADGVSIWDGGTGQSSYRDRKLRPNPEGRNKRSVWAINTKAKQGLTHFATYPEKLIVSPILAGSNEGDVVLDPFFGSGTTGVVAERLGRKWIGIELSKEYCAEAIARVTSSREDKDAKPKIRNKNMDERRTTQAV